ncbi:MAG: amidohydrolase family protein [Armatimonadota bacterium]|nr:amidohydrolase family protein [Armatimonadota bacterium]
MRTTINGATWVVAWDGVQHRLIPNGVVVIEDDRVAYVGTAYQGHADAKLDASGCLILPGLVSVHAHLASQPLVKGFLEDTGNRKLGMSGLYEHLPALADPGREGRLASLRFAVAELLMSGCTTVVDLVSSNLSTHDQAPVDDEYLQTLEHLGIRAYVCPMYRSGAWYTPNGHEVLYRWDEEAGKEGLRRAVRFIERHSGRADGRLQAFLAPAQIDTCSEGLLRDTQRAARDLGVRITTHGAQSHVEIREMVRRHGLTPIQWLDHIGVLSPDVIVAHAIFLTHHSDIRWKDGPDELSLLRRSDTAVAHCPWPYARRGITMESFARYVRSGVTVGLGTDSCPHNVLEEMRWAAILSKSNERDTSAPTASEVLHAATVGGARALGRADLGHLSPGGKADLVLVRCDRMPMLPLRDPIKSLVYYGASQCVDTVLVDGRTVVRGGRVLTVDEAALCRDVQAAQDAALGSAIRADWAARDHWAMAPPSLPLWDGVSS